MDSLFDLPPVTLEARPTRICAACGINPPASPRMDTCTSCTATGYVPGRLELEATSAPELEEHQADERTTCPEPGCMYLEGPHPTGPGSGMYADDAEPDPSHAMHAAWLEGRARLLAHNAGHPKPSTGRLPADLLERLDAWMLEAEAEVPADWFSRFVALRDDLHAVRTGYALEVAAAARELADTIDPDAIDAIDWPPADHLEDDDEDDDDEWFEAEAAAIAAWTADPAAWLLAGPVAEWLQDAMRNAPSDQDAADTARSQLSTAGGGGPGYAWQGSPRGIAVGRHFADVNQAPPTVTWSALATRCRTTGAALF